MVNLIWLRCWLINIPQRIISSTSLSSWFPCIFCPTQSPSIVSSLCMSFCFNRLSWRCTDAVNFFISSQVTSFWRFATSFSTSAQKSNRSFHDWRVFVLWATQRSKTIFATSLGFNFDKVVVRDMTSPPANWLASSETATRENRKHSNVTIKRRINSTVEWRQRTNRAHRGQIGSTLIALFRDRLQDGWEW